MLLVIGAQLRLNSAIVNLHDNGDGSDHDDDFGGAENTGLENKRLENDWPNRRRRTFDLLVRHFSSLAFSGDPMRLHLVTLISA